MSDQLAPADRVRWGYGHCRLIRRALMQRAIEFIRVCQQERAPSIADQRAVALGNDFAELGLLWRSVPARPDFEELAEFAEQIRLLRGWLIQEQRIRGQGIRREREAVQAADQLRLEDQLGRGEHRQTRPRRICQRVAFGQAEKSDSQRIAVPRLWEREDAETSLGTNRHSVFS